MKSTHLAPLLALVLVGALGAVARAQEPPRERLGGRFGYVLSSGGLRESYGDGGDLTLHFAERIGAGFYVEFQLGAIGMGDLLKPEIAEDAFRVQGIQTEMRVLYITGGMQYARPLSELWTAYGGLGLGIYSVSIPWTTGPESDVFSDQHFGGNVTGGAMFRFTRTLNLNAGAAVHYFHNNKSPYDLYYRFTEGVSNPLILEIIIGIVLDLR